MTRRILMDFGQISKLKKIFKTTYPTVRAALLYKTDSELARKIRHTAVKEYGGKEVEY
ncbi:MAG: hypothetical protein ACI30B_01710 [Paludibacteraceae bacterium]